MAARPMPFRQLVANNPNARTTGGHNRLIIAVDFGTTFTGVAYARIPSNQTQADLSQIKVLVDWDDDLSQKVPSIISYATSTEQTSNFGFEAEDDDHRMAWQKLQLDEQQREQELSWILEALKGMQKGMAQLEAEGGTPQYPARNPVNIVGDFLTKVRELIVRHLRDSANLGRLFMELPIDIVITVPAEWSYEARNLTFQAFTQAGFTKRYFVNLQGMYILSEPEAAAIYAARVLMPEDKYDAADFLDKGDCFVLADLGGGTCDLVSMRVKSTDPIIKLEQIGKAVSDKCGATFVDLHFVQRLAAKIGPVHFATLSGGQSVSQFTNHVTFGPGIVRILKIFDQWKKEYDGTFEPTYIALPDSLYDVHDPDNSIENGEVLFDNEDMKEIFHFCLNKIIQLITVTLTDIMAEGYPTQCLFLSGGFSENPYLREAIDATGRMMGLRIHATPDPAIAVVKGAVMHRIEEDHRGVGMVPCPKSYGLSLSQPYSSYLHTRPDVYIDSFDGCWKARDQMIWLMKKGDVIFTNQPTVKNSFFTRRFAVQDPRQFFSTFVHYVEDIPANNRFQRLSAVPAALMKQYRLDYNLQRNPESDFYLQQLAPALRHYLAHFVAQLVIDYKGEGSISIFLKDKRVGSLPITAQ